MEIEEGVLLFFLLIPSTRLLHFLPFWAIPIHLLALYWGYLPGLLCLSIPVCSSLRVDKLKSVAGNTTRPGKTDNGEGVEFKLQLLNILLHSIR